MTLQIDTGFFDYMREYGGYVGYLALLTLFFVVKHYLDKEKEIKRLNDKLLSQAVETVSTNSKIAAALENIHREIPAMEARIADKIESESENIKELILLRNSHAQEIIETKANAKNAPAA